jgi:hypothetical protein
MRLTKDAQPGPRSIGSRIRAGAMCRNRREQDDPEQPGANDSKRVPRLLAVLLDRGLRILTGFDQTCPQDFDRRHITATQHSTRR